MIFDLDETLIHCNHSNPDIQTQYSIPITFPNGQKVDVKFKILKANINVRPYALKILKELSLIFEIIIFTASHFSYANAILDFLDPDNTIISHRLFRDHCI